MLKKLTRREVKNQDKVPILQLLVVYTTIKSSVRNLIHFD